MALVPAAVVHQQEIAKGVRRAERQLSSLVDRVRYDFAEDWTGDLSLFFRIVLTDEAAAQPNLAEIGERIAQTLKRETTPDRFGVHAYFSYRSLSEQNKLKDPAWS